MYTCEFPTPGAIATLTFSTDQDPEEIAAAVQSVFEHYNRRFPFDAFGPELRRLQQGELQPGQISYELRDAVRFAQNWRARLEAPHTNDALIELTNLQASVTAMALESVATLLEATGAEDWTLDLDGDAVASTTDASGTRSDRRKNDADAYAGV